MTDTAPQHKPSIQPSSEEPRILPSGEREFFFDVSTSDLEVNMGRMQDSTVEKCEQLCRCAVGIGWGGTSRAALLHLAGPAELLVPLYWHDFVHFLPVCSEYPYYALQDRTECYCDNGMAQLQPRLASHVMQAWHDRKTAT